MNARVLCIALAIVTINLNADVVKGSVGLNLYPSVEDVALAYDKSSEIDFYKVAARVVGSRLEARKKISLANKAVVELQALCGFKTIRSAVVDGKGNYVTEIRDDDPDCRVFCRCPVNGEIFSASAYVEWDDFERCYCQHLQLRNDHASACGRCVSTNGAPVANAEVYVSLVRTPTEQNESSYNKYNFGRTDTNGSWRVDGIETPGFYRMLMRICDASVIERYDSSMPPYGIKVAAFLESTNGVNVVGETQIPNVTARDRAAAERIFAAYKRKTGKEWPKPAPMTDFPVSTNNVIYVPDIVLK